MSLFRRRPAPAPTLYDRLMGEYPSWLTAARAKGIVQ